MNPRIISSLYTLVNISLWATLSSNCTSTQSTEHVWHSQVGARAGKCTHKHAECLGRRGHTFLSRCPVNASQATANTNIATIINAVHIPLMFPPKIAPAIVRSPQENALSG